MIKPKSLSDEKIRLFWEWLIRNDYSNEEIKYLLIAKHLEQCEDCKWCELHGNVEVH